jgi:hypothetical protein
LSSRLEAESGRQAGTASISDRRRLKEAKQRDNLLRQVWERIEAASGADAAWDDDTLELAKIIAKGTLYWHVPRRPNEEVVSYSQRVHRLRQIFPMFAILPEKDYGSAFGVLLLETLGSPDSEFESDCEAQAEQDDNAFHRRLKQGFVATPCDRGPSLHDAFQKYIEWIRVEYQDPDTTVRSWGRTQVRQVESLVLNSLVLNQARCCGSSIAAAIRGNENESSSRWGR